MGMYIVNKAIITEMKAFALLSIVLVRSLSLAYSSNEISNNIDAEGYFIEGNYEMSNKLWKEVAELNSNFEYAYIGLGNAEYSAKNYETAMEYYEFADAPDDYSNAKTKIRKLASNDIFPVVFITIIALVAIYLIVNMAIKIRRYARGEMTIEARSKRKGEDDE